MLPAFGAPHEMRWHLYVQYLNMPSINAWHLRHLPQAIKRFHCFIAVQYYIHAANRTAKRNRHSLRSVSCESTQRRQKEIRAQKLGFAGLNCRKAGYAFGKQEGFSTRYFNPPVPHGAGGLKLFML